MVCNGFLEISSARDIVSTRYNSIELDANFKSILLSGKLSDSFFCLVNFAQALVWFNPSGDISLNFAWLRIFAWKGHLHDFTDVQRIV